MRSMLHHRAKREPVVMTAGHRSPVLTVVGWLLAAAALTFLVTPLGTVVERSRTASLPGNALTPPAQPSSKTAAGGHPGIRPAHLPDPSRNPQPTHGSIKQLS